MKQKSNFLILCVTVLIAVPSTNAEPIPLVKGNVWVYSYAKQDSSRKFYSTPDPRYHYDGILTLTIDSVTNSNSSNDTTILWLAIIDTGVIHQREWDTSSQKFVTTIKQFKNVKHFRYVYLDDRIFISGVLTNFPDELCPLTYNFLPNEITNGNVSTNRKTDSTEITIQNKKYKLFSTRNLVERSHGGYTYWNTKHQWISQVGTAYWSLDYDARNVSSSGKKELSEFVLQSFNGISIPRINFMAINPRTMSKSTRNPVNQIFQKRCYLTGYRTASPIIPINGCFTIQGQKTTTRKSSQLFLQEMSVK